MTVQESERGEVLSVSASLRLLLIPRDESIIDADSLVMAPKTLIRLFYYNNDFQRRLSIKIPRGAFKTFRFRNTISNPLMMVFAGWNLFTYFLQSFTRHYQGLGWLGRPRHPRNKGFPSEVTATGDGWFVFAYFISFPEVQSINKMWRDLQCTAWWCVRARHGINSPHVEFINKSITSLIYLLLVERLSSNIVGHF